MRLKKSTKKKPKSKITPAERKARKLKTDHVRCARSIFRNLGFERVAELAEAQIEFGGQAGEFDDAFLHENLLLLIEYTTSQSSDVTSHLKNKKIIFSNIVADPKGFLEYLTKRYDVFKNRLSDRFHADKYIIKIVYCSLNSFDERIKTTVSEPNYLDFPILKYFEKLADTIKKSALDEFLNFLATKSGEVARNGIFPNKSQSVDYDGLILPESSSGFPAGYKVVSFYADAAALLSRAYVLRRSGWRSSFQAYQRMIMKSKIEAIRKNLKADRRVFVNNLITTLPSGTHPVTPSGKTIDITQLTESAPVKIKLPLSSNSIGIIDGQHRLYSYYESVNDDPLIAKLRHQQNVLVTGIIFPEGVSSADAERFEAALFLSINSNQKNAPTPLRQEIEVVLNPFSSTAIGRQVIRRLADNGPLAGHVENYFFDRGKLKTSSIVSYGLGPLLKLSGEDSLFKLFEHPEKEKLAARTSPTALESYLQFAASKINIFLGAVRANVDAALWTPDPATRDRLLSVTYVNSFLITLRHLIENGHKIEFSDLQPALKGISAFDFESYHSSQYARMAEKIYEKHFKASADR